jgi:DNA mismatch repair protein MutS2
VAVDEITAIEGPAAPQTGRPAAATRPPTPESSAPDEINVIGSTVEEATDRVDKFLDDSTLANKSRIRIIHGHGTGALRKGLAQFLSSHPLVERVSSEAEDRGGKAITLVDLKS